MAVARPAGRNQMQGDTTLGRARSGSNQVSSSRVRSGRASGDGIIDVVAASASVAPTSETAEERAQGARRTPFPSQTVLLVLREQGHIDRLQEGGCPSQLPDRPRQDQAPPPDRHLRKASAAADAGDQEGAPPGTAAVRSRERPPALGSLLLDTRPPSAVAGVVEFTQRRVARRQSRA